MSAATDSAVARLESVLGANAIFVAKAANRELYAIDGVAPTAFAKPASAAQAAEIVRFAAKENLSVIPVGARTKLFCAPTPARYDVALDLTALDEVAHYDPADLTVSVGAGMGLAKLNAMLREQNQFLPLLVPYYTHATIGGAIAAGLDSPLRNAYGTARDFLLGAEFIDGTGNQIKSGGRVVKNVTGYDLHKLLVGSCGTLAVITRLNFRTFPIPETTQGFLAAFPTHETALAARHKIIHSPLTPLTLDVLNAQAARLFDGPSNGAPVPQIDGSHWYLFAEFSGNSDLLARYKRELAEIAEQSQAGDMHILEDPTAVAALAARLRESIAHVREDLAAPVVVKLAMPPAHHVHAATVLQSVAGAANLPLAIIARASGPILIATSLQPQNSPTELAGDAPSASLFAREILTLARSFGGRAQLVSAPLQFKASYRAILSESLASERTLAKRIKSAFDPNRLFPTLEAPAAPPTLPKSDTAPLPSPAPAPATQTDLPPSPPAPPPSTQS
ncbi:MAG TPA: FAD-binding oxidoreductase [Candidatus Sulfotelmatobacter sp.]|nr:FAD-binding oxidoreductase [Candidatus Sulfotelmatobacter sp.]